MPPLSLFTLAIFRDPSALRFTTIEHGTPPRLLPVRPPAPAPADCSELEVEAARMRPIVAAAAASALNIFCATGLSRCSAWT